MTKCPMARSSRELMLQQETSAARKQTDVKAEHGSSFIDDDRSQRRPGRSVLFTYLLQSEMDYISEY